MKIWFQNRRMKLKRETLKEKSEKKAVQTINNSDGESRSSSTSPALFNSKPYGPPNDREICQNLMKYQNYGHKIEFKIKKDSCYSNNGVTQVEYPQSGNSQTMEAITYNQWEAQTTHQQMQSAQFQIKKEDIYPTATSQMYSEFDIHESSVSKNVQNFSFDENVQFDENFQLQILGSLIGNENSNDF